MSRSEQQSNSGRTAAAVLIGTLGSGTLFSAGLAVPFIGFVSAFLAPIPLGLARLKGGSTAAGASALLAALALALLISPVAAAWYAVQCGMIGLMAPELALRGVSPFRIIAWVTASALAMTALLVAVMVMVTGVDPQQFISKEINAGITQAARLYEQQAQLGQQELEIIKQGMQTVGALLMRIYPALITLNLALISALTLALFQRSAERQGITFNRSPFTAFRAPDLLIWPLILAGFAMLLPMPLITTPAFNVVVVLTTVYFMQGLAVYLSFCERTAFAGTLKVLLAVLLITQPYLAGIVAITGIFDYWGDFRAPRTKQDQNL